jgi:acyl dehydratase
VTAGDTDGVATEAELRDRLVGARMPMGEHRIEPHEAWLAADATGIARPDPSIAHPLFAYIAGIRGMGWDLDEVFARMDASAADGPMFGELAIEQSRPLRVGERLQVEGVVTDVARKVGASGTFDLLTFDLVLADEQGAQVAVVTNRFVFPRREHRDDA